MSRNLFTANIIKQSIEGSQRGTIEHCVGYLKPENRDSPTFEHACLFNAGSF